MPTLILASTSPYRRMLLERLALPFEVVSPGVAEDYLVGEHPAQRAQRLARAKAAAVAERFPDAVVIGSDQVAALGERIFDKPGDEATCRAHLAALSGHTAQFYTGCAVLGRRGAVDELYLDTTTATFRDLTPETIDHYLKLEQPYDCAGGAKVEALGIVLLERVDSIDPTALVGLPLIWLAGALRRAGLPLP